MGIKVLRWPTDAALRARLRTVGLPRVLILEDDSVPPDTDPMEEWVRSPVEPGELLGRVRLLEELSRATFPVLESSGILHFGGRWTSLSPCSEAIVQILLDYYPSPVPRTDLVDQVWPVDAPSRNAVDLQMLRLRRRIEALGLRIRTVTGKGYLLHPVEDGSPALTRV